MEDSDGDSDDSTRILSNNDEDTASIEDVHDFSVANIRRKRKEFIKGIWRLVRLNSNSRKAFLVKDAAVGEGIKSKTD